ncbi:hypothetical protein AWC29_08020 [Mycobacterium triplex]|uniref:ESX-1 secretion-associated protein EspH n=2 Tax=Mycobacterium triplex TaxID=47839 RepID=A0A024JRA8_9MYCO|nr:hypothetical protein AWC29_08020 [Mycobacterium triplex]CDO85912.1 ESX-1 secretion-associated protein EspH [Mycobacterium triplex]
MTNPPKTVSVAALMDGRTQRVRLSSKVTSMTETELAAEIVVLADLAYKKGWPANGVFLAAPLCRMSCRKSGSPMSGDCAIS